MYISCMPLYCSLKTALKITTVTFVNLYDPVWCIIVFHHHMINECCQLMSSVVTYRTNPYFRLLSYFWMHLHLVSNYVIHNCITIFATNSSGLLKWSQGPSEKHIRSCITTNSIPLLLKFHFTFLFVIILFLKSLKYLVSASNFWITSASLHHIPCF